MCRLSLSHQAHHACLCLHAQIVLICIEIVCIIEVGSPSSLPLIEFVAASQVLDQNTVDLIRQLSISMCPYSGVMVITHAVKINLVHSGR